MSDLLKGLLLLTAFVLGARASAAAGGRNEAPGPPPGGSKAFPFPIHQKVLPNGLKVIVVPYDSPGVIAYWTIVRAGSRDEVEPGRSGFAHFFEHMMFRGTKRYSFDAYNDVLKELGADHNAFTSDDLTAYHNLAPASALETLMTLESDRFMNLEYTVEDFKKEAGAVLGEYNKNASNPFQILHEKMREAAFTRHTYGHTTIGYLKDVRDMPNHYEYSLKFFDRFYRPENCILLLVGDVAPERAFAMALAHYGAWKRGSYRSEVPAEPPQKKEKRVEVAWPSRTQPYLYVGYHAPAFSTTDPDLPALDLAAQLLFAESAPLYQKLVVEEQIVDLFSGGAEDHRDPYLFTWVARVKKEADLARVEGEVTQALDALRKDLVPADRLRQVQSHMTYAFAMGLDTPAATARSLAHFLALTGEAESVNRLYALYARITPQQIREAARRTFVASGRTVVTLRHPTAAGGTGGSQ